MLRKLLRNSSQLLVKRQNSILSAAVVIMVMIAISRVLGLIRNRVLAHFFSVEILSVYFAAFRLPEVIFEVLVFGALSSAFIPTFTSFFSRKEREQAWYVAAVSLNAALLFFFIFALIIFFLARPMYQIIAPGFNSSQLDLVARLTRILILAQCFFVISYFLTGVLESLQRFLIPAIAPLFYNLGIIFGAIFLNRRFGIFAPTVGAVIGAFFHFLIQLPLAIHLGFRPRMKIDFSHPGVREIGRLALPRIIELSFLEIGKSAELFLASLVSTAAYTYYTFANSLQLLPVGLFGISIAKAAFPALSYQSAKADLKQFKNTFVASFNEIVFLVIPCSIFLAVLRVPAVRLVFGTARFTWESTVQTGYALSAFCLSIFAQSLVYLLTRAFYALHDTQTPVRVSIFTILINIILGAVFTLGLKWQIWSLAFAFSFASIIQTGILLFSFSRKLAEFEVKEVLTPFLKVTVASFASGGLMFFLLKVLDRSVWDKRLSFLGRFGLVLPTTFDYFVLDTRYALNLLILTGLVALIGFMTYLVFARVLGIKEVTVFAKLLSKLRQFKLKPITITPE